jgi:TRAP-type uncharacterized transport system substrate-binding protein
MRVSTRLYALFVFAVLVGITNMAAAQTIRPKPSQTLKTPFIKTKPWVPHATRKHKVNAGTVTIIADSLGSTSTRMVADMTAVFDKGDELRILPILGQGAEQSITDILYLRGIDFGIVQSDVLSYIKKQGTFGTIARRIHYITKLHNQELHIIARKEIKSLKELAGRKVNLGIKGSGSFITASTIFNSMKLSVQATAFDEINALDKLVLGEIAAMVYVAGKPAPLFAHIQANKDLHLLPVPYNPALTEYLPAKFEHKDYPGLVAEGAAVPTIAVRAVLAVFNWRPGTRRYNKVVKFISTLFTNFHELRKPPRHSKWREVNIHAKVPGWNRFPPATKWVARNAEQVIAKRERLKSKASATKLAFQQFLLQQRLKASLNNPANTKETDRLFKQFIKWKRSRGKKAQLIR